uniref:Uncharacterized protein n=1 Tax=Lepeophtheirus salmonis TaxID=72036 RepID=A0A0K2T9W1_LEPSM
MVVDIMKSEPRYDAPQPPQTANTTTSTPNQHHHIHHHHSRMPPLPPSSGQQQVIVAGQQHNSLQRPGSLQQQNGINGVAIVNGQPPLETEPDNDKWWWICCLEFCFCLL